MSANGTTRRRKTAEPQERRSVKVSCGIDVATHARLCAAAALRGVTITALIEDAIKESLKGIVVIDRRSKVETRGEDLPAPVEPPRIVRDEAEGEGAAA